jgi:predicted CXXCH cytochrome family protein
LAMQVASKTTVLGDFKNQIFKYNGIESKFYKHKGNYFVRTDGADGRLKEFRITHTFGVTPLQQYLITFPDGRLQALNIAWDSRPKEAGGQKWFHLYPDEKVSHDDVLHWTGTAHNWNLRCAECHSTNFQKNYSLAKNHYESTWSEVNVSCEACHGPAKAHIKWANSGASKKSKDKGLSADLKASGTWQMKAGTTIAQHQGKGQNRQQIESCGRCHSRRSVIGEYAHGKRLLDTHIPRLLNEDLYHIDGQILDEVYVYGSFLQSKMFSAGVTCTDCHDAHSLKLKISGNALCSQCHQAKKYDQPKHHFHKVESAGAQCVSCHMPTQTYMVVDPRRDHSIRIPRPDLSEKLKAPNACNQCHKEKSTQWAAEAVKRWYGKKPAETHYGEHLSTAREGKAYAPISLAKLANDKSRSEIIRATALERLQGFISPMSVETAQSYLNSDLPLMRIAALRVLQILPLAQRYQMGGSLLSDPLLAVRIEAARIIAGTSV